MTHSYVRHEPCLTSHFNMPWRHYSGHDSFTCETWPIQMWKMSRDSFICETCLVCHVPCWCYSRVRHDSFTRETWLIHVWKMSCDSFICATCVVSHICVGHDSCLTYQCAVLTHSHIRHDSFICETWESCLIISVIEIVCYKCVRHESCVANQRCALTPFNPRHKITCVAVCVAACVAACVAVYVLPCGAVCVAVCVDTIQPQTPKHINSFPAAVHMRVAVRAAACVVLCVASYVAVHVVECNVSKRNTCGSACRNVLRWVAVHVVMFCADSCFDYVVCAGL